MSDRDKIYEIKNENEKSDKDCECGENYHNIKCADCDKVYCTRSSDSHKFGKNRDKNDYSLCRVNSNKCQICNKFYCRTPWIECESCTYIGRVQCDNCKTNCSLCNKLVHKYCIQYCNQCEVKLCISCTGYSDAVIPIGTPIYWCMECSKKIKAYDNEYYEGPNSDSE